MKKWVLLFFIFTSIFMFSINSYSQEAADVVVFGNPSIYPEENKLLPVTIRVFNRPTYSYLIVSLVRTSSMPGKCGNYPLLDADFSPDLRLHLSDNSGWTDPTQVRENGPIYPVTLPLGSLELKLPNNYGPTATNYVDATVNVMSYDYGAWGVLEATLYEKTGTFTAEAVASDTGTVPRDENGNHIADDWENDFYPYVYKDKSKELVNVGATRNKEGIEDYPYSKGLLRRRQDTVDPEPGPPGNSRKGDGLTAFEEYRGLIIKATTHKRFNPRAQDAFYCIYESMKKYRFGEGTRHPIQFYDVLSYNVSNPFVEIYEANDEDFKKKIAEDVGQLNVNSVGIPDTEPVYAVRIKGYDHKAGVYDPDDKDPPLGLAAQGKPTKYSLVKIFTDAILAFYTKRSEDINPEGSVVVYDRDDIVRSVIGHEVGHTINLGHCPESCATGLFATFCMMRPSIIIRLFNEQGEEIGVERNLNVDPTTHHYQDYDLAGRVQAAQREYEFPESPGQETDQETEEVTGGGNGGNNGSNNGGNNGGNNGNNENNNGNNGNNENNNGNNGSNNGNNENNNGNNGGNTNLPPPPPPSAPTGLNADEGDAQVNLSWTAPSNTSGATITNYAYHSRENNIGDWGAWTSFGSTSTSQDVAGLTNGTLYGFQVRAQTANGWSVASNTVTATPSTVPEVPTGLRGTRHNRRVYLSWTAPNNGGSTITDYEFRYARSGNNFGAWTSSEDTNTSESVRSLTNGVRYKFQVRAVNSNGEGPASNTAYATPATVPGVPQNFETEAGDGEVTLTWEAPSSNGGDAITDYEYSYRIGSSGYFNTWTSAGNDFSETVTGLTNNILYNFRMRAVNSVGNSTTTGPYGATPEVPIVPPGPPRNLRGTPGNRQVTLRWDAPSSNGGATITDYEYRRDTHNDGTWGTWSTTGDSNTSETITGYINGTTYAFQVRAVNSAGAGSASNSITVTPATVPDAPTILSAHRYNGWVSLSLSPSSSNGGSTITDYEYRYSRTYQTYSAWISWGNTNTLNSVFGLTNGTQYQFQVRAVNSVGESVASNTVYATPATVPPVPQNIRLTAGNGQVTLTWDAPSSNGGDAITDYEYSFRAGSSGSWSSWTSAGNDLSETVTGLTNGTAYEFRVRAVNSVGDGTTATGSDSVTPEPPQYPPGAPTSLSASSGNGQVSLSWSAPSSSGTSSISRYDYRYDTNDDGSWASWRSTGSTNTSYTVTGLTNGTLYDFQVRAVSSVGAGSGSNTDTATPVEPQYPPGAPTSLSASSGNGQVSLSWNAPSSSGTSSISRYDYRYDTNDDGSWASWRSTGSTSTSYTVTGLTNGTLYDFQVRAVSSVGTSSGSNTDTATPVEPQYPPGAPTSLSASSGNGQVSLSWSAPSSSGTSSISRYDYRYDTNDDGSWASWTSTGSTSTSYTVTGLTNGTLYDFQVRAVSNVGAGSGSNTDTATPENPVTIPGAPTNLTGTAGDGQVSLSWTAPINDGGGIDDYEYRRDTHNDGTWAPWRSTGDSNTSETITGYTNGTTYAFQIRAVNSAGAGPASNKVVLTPQAPVSTPGAPTGLSVAVAVNGIVIFSWTAPSDNGGATITGYEYRYREQGASSWGSWTSTTLTAEIISGLTNGTTYEIQVRAVNSEGSGTESEILTATPEFVAVRPGAPQNLSATAGDEQVTLSWDAPSSDGGATITDYEYRRDTNDDGPWESWTSTGNGTSTSVTITGLTNGTEYALQVRAVNSVGSGSASSEVTVTPQGTTATVPGAPTNLSASPHSTTVGAASLSWTAPSSDGGSAITGYEWRYCTRRSGGTWSSWSTWRARSSTSTSMTLNSLTSGVLYGFQVRAVNSVGSGPGSNTTSTRGKE